MEISRNNSGQVVHTRVIVPPSLSQCNLILAKWWWWPAAGRV